MENLSLKEIYFQEKSSFKSQLMYSLSLDTLEEKLVIITEKNISSVEKLELSKVEEKLYKIQNIIQDFKDSYISKHALDGTTYKIVAIMKDGSIRKIIGKNKFPKGYNNFVKLVSGE